MKEIPQDILEYLQHKFSIKAHLSFLDFMHDFEILRIRLKPFSQPPVEDRTRIIIEHMDTDYYFNQCTVGVYLRNFFGVAQELDISNHRFIFYTNHFGLSGEIEQLCPDANDRPLIIESFLSRLHHGANEITDVDFDFDQIQYHLLCMMHMTRSHRHAVYNAIKELDNKILMSATCVHKANA